MRHLYRHALVLFAVMIALCTSTQAFALDVAVLHASQDTYSQDVILRLEQSMLFDSVTGVDVAYQTPALAELQNYDSVIVYSDFGFHDAVALGDTLADYIEGGGRVVMAGLAFHKADNELSIKGRYRAEYAPITGAGQAGGDGLTLVPVVVGDPLLLGVVTFNGGSSSYHNINLTLQPNAEVIANWSNDVPMIVRREVNGARQVALNFYPPSNAAREDLWDASTDGVRVMTNALLDVSVVCGDGLQEGNEACDDANLNENDACLSTCVLASCGDGVVWSDEETCDDGNLDDDDGCPSTCQIASCGDGFVYQGIEQCDDGNDDDTDGCLNTCVPASCGDGVVQVGVDACDDGNDDDTDGCLTSCVLASCGDGIVQAGVEQCDDGDANSADVPDACRPDCTLPVCGDGVVDEGEVCDDANDNEEDGCLSTCQEPRCGDGLVHGDEQCDDGNDDDTDGCLTSCVLAICGDGVVQAGVEQCDDGDANSANLSDACRLDCTLPVCGDGVVDSGEVCDAGEQNGVSLCLSDCSGELDGPGLEDDGCGCQSTRSGAPFEGVLLMCGMLLMGYMRRRK